MRLYTSGHQYYELSPAMNAASSHAVPQLYYIEIPRLRPTSYNVSRGMKPEMRNISSNTALMLSFLLTILPALEISRNLVSASKEIEEHGSCIL